MRYLTIRPEGRSTDKTDPVKLPSLVRGEEDPFLQTRSEAYLDKVHPVDAEQIQITAADKDVGSGRKLARNHKRRRKKAVAEGQCSGRLRSTQKKSGENT